MNEGKHQIKSWLNRVLRIVGREGMDDEQSCRWIPASGSGQQLEFDLDVPVRPLKKARSAAVHRPTVIMQPLEIAPQQAECEIG